jgi:hypothetical protein
MPNEKPQGLCATNFPLSKDIKLLQEKLFQITPQILPRQIITYRSQLKRTAASQSQPDRNVTFQLLPRQSIKRSIPSKSSAPKREIAKIKKTLKKLIPTHSNKKLMAFPPIFKPPPIRILRTPLQSLGFATYLFNHDCAYNRAPTVTPMKLVRQGKPWSETDHIVDCD